MWCTGSSWSWVRILLSFTPICFLSNWRELDFHERFHLEISSKCDIKQKTVLPCVNFVRGENGYSRWDLILTVFLDWYAKNEKPKERLFLQGAHEGAAIPKGAVPSKQKDTFIFSVTLGIEPSTFRFSVRGLFLEKLFYVCRVCTQEQSFNYFEIDTMRLSVNEAKLTGLWAGNCCTIKLVFISNFAFGYHAFRETGSQCSNLCPN